MTRYQQKLERDNEFAAVKSRAGRDIAAGWPGDGDTERRDGCAVDLRRFLEVYFAQAFNLPWSPDHLRILPRMQAAVMDGGLQALAMPRGFGKTSISLRAALWALLYRHARFVCLIGPTEKHATKLLKQIKFELLYNDLLGEDFPHVCYPIRRLENNARRAAGQLFRGETTRIEWTANSVSLPVMPDDVCGGTNVSGSIITVAGLTGALRGQSHELPEGAVVRPELVILDDPQTRASATSLAMTEERLAIVTGDVLGMAGAGRQITAVMPCTVIRQGDMADQLLDRKAYPEWRGERTKAVYAWPANEELWEEYHRIRADEFINGGDGKLSTEFYRSNRAAMDAGASVAWPERFNRDELSAIQHLENQLHKLGRPAFFAEFQNDPLPDELGAEQLVAADVVGRGNGLMRGQPPLAASRLVAFVDVQQRLLYWMVCAVADDFTVAVIDYGTEPDQKRSYFTLADAQRTLARAAPGAGLEGSIDAGLTRLTDRLIGREWGREDGTPLRIERLLVDAGYQTDTVKTFCRRTPHAAMVTASHGRGIGAKAKPLGEYHKKDGERLGFHWLLSAGSRQGRHLLIDTYFWKSFIAERIKRAVGDRGALTLFGNRNQDHRLLADHLTAEYAVKVEANGRSILEWQLRPERRDNHWFDCLVGCYAAASLQGCQVPAAQAQTAPATRKRWSDAYWAKRGGKPKH